ncbi:MAG: hypothetical protein ACE5J9_08290 [Methanosarcinales archaeon]
MKLKPFPPEVKEAGLVFGKYKAHYDEYKDALIIGEGDRDVKLTLENGIIFLTIPDAEYEELLPTDYDIDWCMINKVDGKIEIRVE